MPDSSSTTSPTGASLSDILFLFVLEKYIVCDVCGLRSPSFESSSVLYISLTDTSSMQNLILEGLQQKLQKSCSRCNKNTRHIESSYILQPPKYLLLFVNRFRYINNNITKNRCAIPMDTTVRLGPLKFSIQAIIDHHGPSIDSGITLHLLIVAKNILLQRSRNYGVWNYWYKLLYCIYCIIQMDWHMIFGLEQEGGSLIAPMALAHPLHPIDNRSRNKRRNLWVGRCVSSWWPWFPSRSSLLIYTYIFICMYIPYTSSVIGRIYNGSVIQYWRSCTPSRSIGECAVPGLNATFCFLWFTNCVLLFDKNLILGCLWLLVFVLNNVLILGIWCSTIPHLPGFFVPGPSLRISD